MTATSTVKTQLLAHIKMSLAVVLVAFSPILSEVQALSSNEGDMADLVTRVIDSKHDQDTDAITKTLYTKTADQCEEAYFEGDTKRAEPLFAQLLLKMKGCTAITSLIKQMHGRVVMFSEDDREPKCHSLCMYKSMLRVTEKTLGPDHRFVGDALNYIADYYSSTKMYRDSIETRKRELAVYKKALGADDALCQRIALNLAYDYYLTADYANAQNLVSSIMSVSTAKGYKNEARSAGQLEAMLVRARLKRVRTQDSSKRPNKQGR